MSLKTNKEQKRIYGIIFDTVFSQLNVWGDFESAGFLKTLYSLNADETLLSVILGR